MHKFNYLGQTEFLTYLLTYLLTYSRILRIYNAVGVYVKRNLARKFKISVTEVKSFGFNEIKGNKKLKINLVNEYLSQRFF